MTTKTQARTCRLTLSTPTTGVLYLLEGETVTGFHLEERPESELGGRTFRLEKFAAARRDEWDGCYTVRVGGEGGGACGCPGHKRWGWKVVCRHQAALAALVKAGRI